MGNFNFHRQIRSLSRKVGQRMWILMSRYLLIVAWPQFAEIKHGRRSWIAWPSESKGKKNSVLHLITVKARRVAPLSRNPESLTVTSYCKKICMSEMTTSIFSFITLFTPHKQALSLSISYQPHRDSPVANAIIFLLFACFFACSTSTRRTATCVDTWRSLVLPLSSLHSRRSSMPK